ncbi:MAG: PEP-CTERM sorting domain-containing protein [Puniceicoccales bacterium]
MKLFATTRNSAQRSIVAIAALITTSASGNVVATDNSVPAIMDQGGTSGNLAEYILGVVDDYEKDFGGDVFTGSLKIGDTQDFNSLRIQNGARIFGAFTSLGYQAGSDNNEFIITGSGTFLNGGNSFNVGTDGSNNSGRVSNGADLFAAGLHVGLGQSGQPTYGANNSMVVDGGSWRSASFMSVGEYGSGNSLVVQNGGTVDTIQADVGRQAGSNNNSALVTGFGSRINVQNNFYLSFNSGSQNFLTIADQGLVKVGTGGYDTLLSFSNDSRVRLDGGFLAMVGDQTSQINALINVGQLEVWDAATDSWIQATPASVSFAYFTDGTAAEAFSGYADLANYTIVTTAAVPEPALTALLIGAGALLAIKRRKTKLA